MKHIFYSNHYIWNIEQECFKRRKKEMNNPLIWIYTHLNNSRDRKVYYEI